MEKKHDISKDKLNSLLEESGDSLRIEDYFDINSLSAKDIKLITTDICVFLQGEAYCSNISDDGEIIIKESAKATMPIEQVRQKLKELGFKSWQIKAEIGHDKDRIVILYADIAKNTDVVFNVMSICGWAKAGISNPMLLYGVNVRAMSFV